MQVASISASFDLYAFQLLRHKDSVIQQYNSFYLFFLQLKILV